MLGATDREILRLAFPAFLALVAEPLFLLADAAIVGHLGTPELAGLGVAAVVLQTVVGLCVFLAYGTTGSVARRIGAGDRAGALRQGLDGVWLAVLIGVVTTLVGIALTPLMIEAFDTSTTVAGHATTYLRLAFLGTTPLLVMLATTGILRGLQDTRTPLVVAVVGNVLNVVLNLVLVYGVGSWGGLGIAGSAIGSVLAQVISAGLLLAVVVRLAHREGTALRPHLGGVGLAARAGVPLLIRTLTLRAALLLTVYAVVLAASPRTSERDLATHQLALTLWTFLAFALDAIAIAAQAITGRTLGAGDVEGTRVLTRRMIEWGLVSGAATGVGLAVLSPWLGRLFTDDVAVRDLLVPVLIVAAIGQPVAGVVFVLDGVLIGAGDGRYLAWAGLVALVAYLPLLLLAALVGGSLVWVWVTFSLGFISARAVVLLHRARGTAWLVTGSL
ncbi:MATE efflux family protein [metagenome]|uniref:MATE efflux family protein n=1 Tax=metagenome TaxID=256318 RepID=A0A2P2BZ72_9ZZZZ